MRPYSFYVEGRPHPKERPRFAVRGGKVMTFTPPKTAAAEAKIAESYQGPMFGVPVCVNVIFDVEGTAVVIEPIELDQPSKLRGDIDNYSKTLLDGLNGIAWSDDRLVVKLTAVKI